MSEKFKKRKEIEDIFGNKIRKGSLVFYSQEYKDTINAGIFLHENKASYTIAIKSDKDYHNGYINIHAKNIFLAKNPAFCMHIKSVIDSLSIIDALKRQRKLPKSFDENIAWGINGD